MARNAKQCQLFSSGKVLFSVSFYFGTQTKKLFSVSWYIGIKITPQLPHSCHTVTPQLTFLCALPQQVPYKHPTSNPTSYPTSWQVRSRRAFWLFTSARWSISAASVSASSTLDGATLQNKGAFIYGGAVALETEIYLSDAIALTASVKERLVWGNSTGHFHTQFGIGMKFIIN